jgi:hypothetical protein
MDERYDEKLNLTKFKDVFTDQSAMDSASG